MQFDISEVTAALGIFATAMFTGIAAVISAQAKKQSSTNESQIRALQGTNDWLEEQLGLAREQMSYYQDQISQLKDQHDRQIADLKRYYEQKVERLKGRIDELERNQGVSL
jgi:peptidoglycan hydrolase CwlO-like protein